MTAILRPESVHAYPVTPADRKRASYFRLTIPSLAVAPVVEPTADPGDSWDTWDDDLDTPWELGPEADPIEPARVEPRGRNESDGPRPSVFYGFIPTLEADREAAAVLAERRRPALPRRPRTMTRQVPTMNSLRDEDIYPAGCCS